MRGPWSVPMGSARSVAAGSPILAVASGCRRRVCLSLRGAVRGSERRRSCASCSFLKGCGAVLVGCVWPMPVLVAGPPAAGCCVRCCAVLADPASPAEPKRPTVLG